MASATKVTEDRGGWVGGRLLTGELMKVATLDIVVIAVQEAPVEWKNSLVLLIEEVNGCEAFSLNKTNVRSMVKFGGDDTDSWIGSTVTLKRITVTNPITGKLVPGIDVTGVKLASGNVAPGRRKRSF